MRAIADNQQSKHDWENIFNSMTDMVTIHDNNFNIICANNAAENNLKLPSLTLGNVKCFKYYHGTDCPPEGCPSCQCIKTGIPGIFELFEPHLNKYIEIRALPRFDSKNQIAGIIHLVRDITQRKKWENKLSDSSMKLRSLNAHLLSVREEERQHIAREIHDELGQSLTALKMDLVFLKKNVPEDKKLVHETVKSMSKVIDKTINMVQRIATELRPKLLDELGLQAALKWQARKFHDRTGITCKVVCNVAETNINQKLDIPLFRIFQESLTNVCRHARATKVQMRLTEKDGHLLMEARDNGRGITKAEIDSPKSLGLIGIRERVHFLRGKIEINGTPNKGTRMIINIPLVK
jgi:signal transduction histidine kinase